jgi:hypothetical protein
MNDSTTAPNSARSVSFKVPVIYHTYATESDGPQVSASTPSTVQSTVVHQPTGIRHTEIQMTIGHIETLFYI